MANSTPTPAPSQAPSQAARGFTRAEKRTLRFESVSLAAVFVVGMIACAISFIALRAVGAQAGLGGAAFLLPIAIDGSGLACSVGIIRSVSEGEALRGRASEWFGLVGALALSILGNITHSLQVGSPDLPTYVKVAYATAVPIILAYSLHIYGRAMSKGISAHVLAEDPHTVRADIWQVRDQATTPAAKPAPKPATSKPAKPAGESKRPTLRAVESPAQKEARRLYDEHVDGLVAAGLPATKPNAEAIHAAVAHLDGAYGHPQSTRRMVSEWWKADPRG